MGGPPRAGYIVSPRFDGILFILSPLLALGLAMALRQVPWVLTEYRIGSLNQHVMGYFIAIWTNSHLVAVAFRSHGNPAIFRRFRFRFVGVPIALFLALMVSDWAIVCTLVIGAMWDIYHSSMQTFGFCRLYDQRRGNDPQVGRSLDIWLNHLIYIGPILGGLSLKATLSVFEYFTKVDWSLPGELVANVDEAQRGLALSLFAVGLPFVMIYIALFRRYAMKGYRISPQKVTLLISTGCVSIYAWGFLPPLEAFFVGNFFHGLQYFAIVWAVERKNIRRTFRVENLQAGTTLALIGFLVIVFTIGAANTLLRDHPDFRWMLSFGLVCSIMHFWYDGFVWSVRERAVKVT